MLPPMLLTKRITLSSLILEEDKESLSLEDESTTTVKASMAIAKDEPAVGKTNARSGPVTTDEKIQKKNDVKARNMLLMTLPNEHLLTFNQYKDAKTLFPAIQTRFGGNEATKKTQKTLLKQMYENFNAQSTDLPSEWNTHVVVWRYKSDLDTISFNDLYKKFKIVEQEVKETASSNSNSENMEFVSSPSNTNELYTAHGDLKQLHEHDQKEMDLKWQLALLNMRTRRFFQKTGRKITINGSDTAGFDKSKVECFNCHKLGHFAWECIGSRNQDNRNINQDSSRRTMNVEDTSSKAMLAIDGAGFDWSYMAYDEVPTNMALMAFSNSEELVTDDKLKKKTVFPTVAKINFVRPEQQEKLVRKLVKLNSTVVNAVRANQVNAVKASSCRVWRPTKLDRASITLKRHNYGHPQKEDQSYVDSGCSRHMIGNMSYLLNFKKFDEGYVTLGEEPKEEKLLVKELLKLAETFNIACYVDNKVLVVKPHNKTPYELFRGRTPSLSFMTPFGCHVTILNTLDYLSNFDKKLDKGLFIRYSLNSKDFRVYNIRIRKVEEKLHIKFLEDKPIITCDGPKWLFDIDVLTKSMNYVPVVAGINSNDFVGTEESIGTGNSSKETGSSQDYILMPLWKHGSLFDSSSKNVSNVEPQPFNDAGKKDDEGGFDYQKRPENISQDVNNVRPSINTASTNINTGSLNINTVSPTVTTAPPEATYADFFGDEAKVDMSNITTTYLVPSTPNTRIHKDLSLDHVIGDIQSSVQTRRMINEQGFISAVYEGKTREDLHTCLFACFLSQEEPKKILVDLPYGKRAIGIKWVYRNKKDERCIVIRNKARLVTQGYTQEERIDYDEVFAPVATIEAIRLFLAYASFKDFVVYQMDVKSAFLYGKIKKEVYVCQPPGFEYPDFPDKVYKVEKALYGLH
nr:hypothetical protein [Tanacetum cinerariifolium]